MVILLYFMVYLMLLTPDDKTRQIVFFAFTFGLCVVLGMFDAKV